MATVRFIPRAELLADRTVPDATAPVWPAEIGQVVSADDGGSPVVHLLERGTNRDFPLTAFDPSFRGGVRTALGDVTGDGIPDVVAAAGSGGGPHVKVFDGKTGAVVRSFYAYAPIFTGGVEVATGDVNRDGYDDIVTGAGASGGPHVKVFDGRTGVEIASFYAFDSAFRGGVYVASGDLNRDGYDDIITGAGSGGGPHVRAFDGKTGAELTSFYAFDPSFRGGARVASGDLNGDGVGDVIVAAGPGGGPHVKAFDSRTGQVLFNQFVADAGETGGVRLAVAKTFDHERDGLIARTRTGDLVHTPIFVADDSHGWSLDVWVGDGDPPPGVVLSTFMTGLIVGDTAPIRTVEGPITAVAADGKSITVRRGDGTPLTVLLVDESYPPLPPGTAYFDGGPLQPAEIRLGDQTVGVDQLTVGRWVRVLAGRAHNPAATEFNALRVQLL